mmetsp:Transcript_18174/g.30978  ORF Transcript_18174/g.30978 Transcript_18174/m.30978 type:complete len:103 (-) Transcript_18174:304-612(-)
MEVYSLSCNNQLDRPALTVSSSSMILTNCSLTNVQNHCSGTNVQSTNRCLNLGTCHAKAYTRDFSSSELAARTTMAIVPRVMNVWVLHVEQQLGEGSANVLS